MKRDINMDCFPLGTASDKLTKGCIVLEGGAFRGTYTEGVLDALMLSDINLECVLGVSAGAMNGLNYVSGQIGRTIRITLKYRHDSRYMGLKALKKDKGLFGFGFIFGELMDIEFFDKERLMNSPMRFLAAATNCETGETEFFEKTGEVDIYEAVKASSSLPLVSQPVNLNGTEYFDGGCSKKVPYEWAFENGYDKVVVVRTRHADFRKELNGHGVNRFIRRKYDKYPEFLNTLSKSDKIYNDDCDRMQKLQAEGKLFIISPSEPLDVSRFEGDLKVITKLYELGFNDTMNNIEKLKKYLGTK